MSIKQNYYFGHELDFDKLYKMYGSCSKRLESKKPNIANTKFIFGERYKISLLRKKIGSKTYKKHDVEFRVIHDGIILFITPFTTLLIKNKQEH